MNKMKIEETQHPLYPYTEEEKQGIRKELGLKENGIQSDIDAILGWFKKQPHLVSAGISRAVIERFLITAKGSLERTKERIDAFYKYRSLAPELIQHREKDLINSNKDIWTFYYQAAIPKLYKGQRISVLSIEDPDPNNFFIDILFRNTFMYVYPELTMTAAGVSVNRVDGSLRDIDTAPLLGDIRLHHDYMIGEVWVVDVRHCCLGHLLRLNPSVMHKTAQIFQEGLGLRVSSIHVLNCPSYGHMVLNAMKQFFKPKVLDRITFHLSLDDLYKHIPKSHLPKDYGGDLPSLEEFKVSYEAEFRSERTKKLLLDSSKMISDESKRPGQRIYEEYMMTGSFKKLDLD